MQIANDQSPFSLYDEIRHDKSLTGERHNAICRQLGEIATPECVEPLVWTLMTADERYIRYAACDALLKVAKANDPLPAIIAEAIEKAVGVLPEISAAATLARITPVNDPLIHEILESITHPEDDDDTPGELEK